LNLSSKPFCQDDARVDEQPRDGLRGNAGKNGLVGDSERPLLGNVEPLRTATTARRRRFGVRRL
jgi:hypothetical protein